MSGVLIVDNYDSFTFSLVDEFTKRGASVEVWRSDTPAERLLELAEALPPPHLIVISPGPGTPAHAGSCLELVRIAAGRVPLFGVCLGHQVIVESFGGEVGQAPRIVHGKTSSVTHCRRGVFDGLPSPLTVGRYHSLAATRLSDDVTATARLGEIVMAIEHRTHRIAGVQFHPESILTPDGGRLLENVLAWAGSVSRPAPI
jgi:anthranilate synthase/aminodeoxychorismate synthase-like glutamine amidotransferase